MSIIWSIGVTVYPVFCVGYITECVYVLSCFILAYGFFIICILSECMLYVVAALWRNK